MNPFNSIKRFLRKPPVILGEIGAMAVAGALGAVLPEKHIFQSIWFGAIALLAAASLLVVVAEQCQRLRRQWRQPLSPSHFESAPFKLEFERPATGAGSQRKSWSERRLGAAGSLVFHAGLLLLIVAGAWRALFVSEAAVNLLEGETLAPGVAWPAQWPGVLGRPLQLDQSVTLEAVNGSRYPDGNLRELHAKLSAGIVAVNHQLQFGGSRLYLGQEFGPSALLEWNAQRREAVLLTSNGGQDFRGESAGPNSMRAYLHCEAERPAAYEVRVMCGDVLLAAGMLRIGQTLSLPDGGQLALHGAPMWARLHGSRDPALWLAYFGMVLTMAGAAMMFCLIRLDFCVAIMPSGGRETVFVAMKPQRFAPLFQERFEQFVREQTPGNEDARWNMEDVRSANKPSSAVHHPSSPVAGTVGLCLLLASLAFTAGCNRVSPAQARQLVEHYNQLVADAYRRGDVRVADSVVGPNEGRKLAGLIGVRLDLGITLDSHLLSLEVAGVERKAGELFVHTKEKWRYRNLQIGTGKPAGEPSEDFYEMTYCFTNLNRTWVVDEIKFAAPPQVGCTNAPWTADLATMHGLGRKEPTP